MRREFQAKGRKVLLLVGMIGISPLVLVGCVFLFNTINPMQWTFVTRVEVANQSGRDIWITPVGTRGAEGRKGRLPVFMLSVPSVPALRSGGFYLAHGQSLKIRYDWDDVNFSEIAVKDQDGHLYELIIDTNPTVNRYHRPTSNNYIVPPLETLPAARSEIANVTLRPDSVWVQFALTVGGLIPIFLFQKMLTMYKKQKTVDVLDVPN